MVLVGDVHPMPLAREDHDRRVRLGRVFLSRRSLARAAAEYRRALYLRPGSRAAAAGLRAVESAGAELAGRFR
jgi:hypothetical protein